MQLEFSFIIPVYNRPEEVQELLNSFLALKTVVPFEIVLVEDGSSLTSEEIVANYKNRLNISYFFKPNTGPGDSRNYGMARANGNYFIILDSDCILPQDYLQAVCDSLNEEFVHCFGGPDAAHSSFTNLQKAIDFAMTSFLSTGGIRGKSYSVDKFQPRSFNMGISKEAFLATQGFGTIHPGEDPDLTIRLWKKGFKTKLIPNAKVFHKRRISLSKFYKQVHKFGLVRPILNSWHPETAKITYWFPTVFIFGFFVATITFVLGFKWLLLLYATYFILFFISALVKTKNLLVALQALLAVTVQFAGYGWGFLKSTFFVTLLRRKPEIQFPQLFFKN